MIEFKCPRCNGTALRVVVQAWATLHQDKDNIETEIDGVDQDWDESSLMQCTGCKNVGPAHGFEVKNQP